MGIFFSKVDAVITKLSSSKADKDTKLSFSSEDADPETYRRFIEALRSRLTAERPLSHGIPVLPAREDVPDDHRFLLVDLTDTQGNTITVAIDVVNAYVVGYAARGTAYFLEDNVTNPQHRPPVETLFPETTVRHRLGFNGSYGGLSSAAAVRSAAPSREGDAPTAPSYLGLSQLDNAIRNLFFAGNESLQAKGFTVIIQMLSEAARFPMIEEEISNRMVWGNPAPYARGYMAAGEILENLENNWSSLSQEIQRLPPNQTEFRMPILLQNDSDENDPTRSIAMLLYDRNPPGPSHPRDEF